MPIPVGRFRDVDREGGTPDGGVRLRQMGRPRWVVDFRPGHPLRIGVVSPGLQPDGALRWFRAARPNSLARSGPGLFTAALAPEPRMEEQQNHVDDHGADDALGRS